ncbi:MAG: potassium channel family protein [Syntrophobacteraceae bacterium]
MTSLQPLVSKYLQHRFAWLFFSLLLTLSAAPVLSSLGLRFNYAELFLLINLIAATFSMGTGRSIHIGLVFVILAVVTRSGYGIFGIGELLPASQAIAAWACIMCSFGLIRFIFSRGTVDTERIFSCLSLYLLIGLVFGLLYLVAEELLPSSLVVQVKSGNESEHIQMAHTVYFSFVTLGTLGYGDIVPVGGVVRALAITEAMLGQMYLAVVVARLVALYRGSAESNE